MTKSAQLKKKVVKFQGSYFIFSVEEECLDDGFGYTPKSLYSWLSRVMYNRRSNINPLWNTYIVAGMPDGEPVAGMQDGEPYVSVFIVPEKV